MVVLLVGQTAPLAALVVATVLRDQLELQEILTDPIPSSMDAGTVEKGLQSTQPAPSLSGLPKAHQGQWRQST